MQIRPVCRYTLYAGNKSRQTYRPTERPENEMIRLLFANSQIPIFMKIRCSGSQVFMRVETDGQSRFNRRSSRYTVFCPHDVLMLMLLMFQYFARILQQTAIIALYSINWLVSLCTGPVVPYVLQTTHLHISHICFRLKALYIHPCSCHYIRHTVALDSYWSSVTLTQYFWWHSNKQTNTVHAAVKAISRWVTKKVMTHSLQTKSLAVVGHMIGNSCARTA